MQEKKICIWNKRCFKCIYPPRLWVNQVLKNQFRLLIFIKIICIIVMIIRGNISFLALKQEKNLNLGDCVRWQGISMNAPRGAFVGHFCLIWHCGHFVWFCSKTLRLRHDLIFLWIISAGTTLFWIWKF